VAAVAPISAKKSRLAYPPPLVHIAAVHSLSPSSSPAHLIVSQDASPQGDGVSALQCCVLLSPVAGGSAAGTPALLDPSEMAAHSDSEDSHASVREVDNQAAQVRAIHTASLVASAAPAVGKKRGPRLFAARVGVDKIATCEQMRRSGAATTLLEHIRWHTAEWSSTAASEPVPPCAFAFCEPLDAGCRLAQRFCGVHRFLTFK